MVAVVRDRTGAPVGGIHRTYLLDDGSAKAPPGKKMLGQIAAGSVRLAPIRDDGHLGIAEGIETALSAQAIFNIPTWAALSAEGLRRWEWLPGSGPHSSPRRWLAQPGSRLLLVMAGSIAAAKGWGWHHHKR